MSYILARLKEASTWRGLFLIATAFGLNVAPELQDAIVTVGLSAAGAVGALFPDK